MTEKKEYKRARTWAEYFIRKSIRVENFNLYSVPVFTPVHNLKSPSGFAKMAQGVFRGNVFEGEVNGAVRSKSLMHFTAIYAAKFNARPKNINQVNHRKNHILNCSNEALAFHVNCVTPMLYIGQLKYISFSQNRVKSCFSSRCNKFS